MKLVYRNDHRFDFKKDSILIPVILSNPVVTVEFSTYGKEYLRGFGNLKQIKLVLPKTVTDYQYIKYSRQEVTFEYLGLYQVEFAPNLSLGRVRLSLYIPSEDTLELDNVGIEGDN